MFRLYNSMRHYNFMQHLCRIVLLGIFLSLFYVSPSFAVESFDKLWGLVTYTGHYDSYTYQVEPQIRLVNRGDGYEQFLLNMGAGQSILPNLMFWLGQTVTNFSPANAVTEDVSSNDLNEYRFWQQLLWTPSSATLLRSRLEERYSFENKPWAVRLRERGYWTIPIKDTYSFVLSDEIFFNLKPVPWVPTSSVDQNRFFVGILKKLTDNISLNISYMNQYICRVPAEDNHALVLNVFINMPE